MEPLLSTKFGSLLKNAKNPTFLNFVVLRSHPDFSVILNDLERVLKLAGLRTYQIVINRGDFVKYYNVLVQVKLRKNEDLRALESMQYDTLPFGKQWADAVDDEERNGPLEIVLDSPQQ